MSEERRIGDRKAQKRRWDNNNRRTVCAYCGTLIWDHKEHSGLCRSCSTKRMPRDEHGGFLPRKINAT